MLHQSIGEFSPAKRSHPATQPVHLNEKLLKSIQYPVCHCKDVSNVKNP